MKLTAFLFLFIYSLNIYSKDTTVVIDLNFDRVEDKIQFLSNENRSYSLTINGKQYVGYFDYGEDAYLEIMDLNKNDNLREVVLKGYGPSDNFESVFFQYVNGEVVPCGYIPGGLVIKTKGNSILYVNTWMGFWEPVLEYEFDTKNKTLNLIDTELYDVNIPATVTRSFNLMADKDDNSVKTMTLKPGTKITLLKADITPFCEEGSNYIDDMMCDWFYIKTEDGRKGWCRIKNFNENVEGLIWAG